MRLIGFTLSVFAALAVGAVFVFRARGRVAPFRTPGYPVTPIAFIAMSLCTAYFGISAQPRLSFEIIGMLVAGSAIYVVTSRGKPRTPIEADE